MRLICFLLLPIKARKQAQVQKLFHCRRNEQKILSRERFERIEQGSLTEKEEESLSSPNPRDRMITIFTVTSFEFNLFYLETNAFNHNILASGTISVFAFMPGDIPDVNIMKPFLKSDVLCLF